MARNWYPVIDYNKCVGCLSCANFCPHGVYTVCDGKPVVTNPLECVEFCKGCQKLCDYGAINYATEVKTHG